MTAKEVLRGKKLDEDDKEMEKIEEVADRIGSKNPAASQSSADVPIHAKKWIDYTSKYGLGYILSNGCVGVFFNDATKIILEREGKKFDYYERKDKEDVKQSHTLENYPKEIEKKVTLLAHFKSYLDQNFKKEEIEHFEDLPELVYVKKWIKTRHAKMFRLSNKVVQVYFKDKTEILLCSQTKRITYTNKEGERATYPLTAALESTNEEMNKRMQYTKNILTHLLQNNTASSSQQ